MTEGHEPKPVYGVPHFDLHFYLVPRSQRSKMVINREADKKVLSRPVATGYMPSGYVLAPGTEIPCMGAHWVDMKAPELSGKPFTHTLIYGSYAGKVVFIESKPNAVHPLPLPKKVAKSGLYPTEYCVRWNETRREVSVSLRGFVYLKATKPGA